jgi:AdoMet-dependent rRNA methyltransferase SPB1
MQLRMVAPLDIGLEQTDMQLGMGQDDVFDLDNVERGLTRRRDVVGLADGEMGAGADSDDDGGAAGADADDDEVLDSDEERERKVKGLEDELDGLYDAYRTKLSERDAKFKVKEARKKNALREHEWGGVKADGSDAESDDGDESAGEGGYDVVARRKAADEGEASSGDDDDEEPVPRKRRKLANGKSKGLITSLDAEPKPTSSKAAQVWFSQDLFAGVPDLDEIEDDEEESDKEEEPSASEDEADIVADEVRCAMLPGIHVLICICRPAKRRMTTTSRSCLKSLIMMTWTCGMSRVKTRTRSSRRRSRVRAKNICFRMSADSWPQTPGF